VNQPAATPPEKPRVLTFADGLDIMAMLRDQLEKPADDAQRFVRFCLDNVGWSAAQHLQDLWVAYELQSRRGGYFVEFGAMDGVKWSNSYALEKHLGWNGIVSEPARIWHPAVNTNRGCAVDRRCVWTKTGETIRFNQTPIVGLSTIDAYSSSDGHARNRVTGERYDVETVSLTDLLAHWRAPRRIDYLSIDTEGSEYDILQAFDWSQYEIRLITVEHNHSDKRAPIFEMLSGMGYVRKFEQFSHADDWYVLGY
jgi:FkbM family methyltransferase